jgi:2-methylcitrate dehydratase PrpD
MKRDPVHLSGALADPCAADWTPRFDAAQHGLMTAIVRTAFIDTVACMLAGREEPSTRALAAWSGFNVASTPVRAQPATLARAALFNAACGHALDFDDVGLAGHPSVILVPALLALHDAEGIRGAALVHGYAKGYAVWAELQRRMRVHLHGRGWHPTAVFGTVAAAATVAAARGLDAHRTQHALGIAASCAAGVVANFGSATKSLQVGRAVSAGIEAVDLARAGVDASPDALDGPAGLLAALAGRDQVELDPVLAPDFEQAVLRTRPGIKKYPVCYAAHRAIDGVLDLAAAHGLRADAVQAIDVSLSATTAGVLRHHAPTTLAEARFSLEFTLATALVRGALGVREVCEASLVDPRVRALMERVRTHTVDTRCPLEPSFAYEDRVTLTLADGSLLDSGPIRFARGHAMRPLDDQQVAAKLRACARDEAEARAALDRVDHALTS